MIINQQEEQETTAAEPGLAVSGSIMREKDLSEWPAPTRKSMPPLLFYLGSMKAIFTALRKGTNFFKGSWIFLRSILWDSVFNKPVWHPEYFNLKSSAEEEFFKMIFKEFSLVITMFNSLKKSVGTEKADEVMGLAAIPITLPYLKQEFHPIENLTDILDVIRQLSNYLADYVGEEKGFEGKWFISDDRTEARLHVSKCAYIQVLKAYGLKSYAAFTCLADHVEFDSDFPNMVFCRKQTIGVGDSYCDHVFRIRTPEDCAVDEENYEDCYKIKGGREAVARYTHVK
ncbi:MAG: L-2-amino-thiazoline-4-carboxylic acid hydrolase [bacterium]|nr:L-2-amino-thiazoline-4-carboxylic acid hydrolase [bacterium]